ncbi:galactose-1-phosphate uridylyltransferase [Chytridium lagenaria]|nr:galactose-1-phosphate uridylyltransferase [Chytridium lagenaria]
MDAAFQSSSHRRFNPLTQSWVLCFPHRSNRPWLGQNESAQEPSNISYDHACYLCPRNTRANGEKNPDYSSTFTFTNDFPAVQPTVPVVNATPSPLFKAKPVRGVCKVLCFSPNHGLTMPRMSIESITSVVEEWSKTQSELEEVEYIRNVQIFENKGAVMGCSNPHPHGQVWATEDLPEEPAKELVAQKSYHADNHTCLLCDYVKEELANATRIVCQNETFVCLVPYWALWPFETLVLPKAHVSKLTGLDETQKVGLADILKRITCRYDNLFLCSFPYSMGLHGAPKTSDTSVHDYTHFHLHFYPPLLRSASVKKFLVGFEMLGEPQRDLTAEQAADRLRGLSEVHYSEK